MQNTHILKYTENELTETRASSRLAENEKVCSHTRRQTCKIPDVGRNC